MLVVGVIRSFLTISLLLLTELTWTNSLVAKPDLFAASKIELPRGDPSHVFIFGLGYTGLALASSLKTKFPDCLISGTCRSLSKADNLKKLGIQTHIFDPDTDDSGLDDLGVQALLQASHIVTLIPPVSDFDRDSVLHLHKNDILRNIVATSSTILVEDKIEEMYDGINDDIYEDDIDGYGRRMEQNLIDEGQERPPSTHVGLWVGYVSTTGVYGDHSGEWVTEQSATLAPPTSKAFHRIIAENDWLALCADCCRYTFYYHISSTTSVTSTHFSDTHTSVIDQYSSIEIYSDGPGSDAGTRSAEKFSAQKCSIHPHVFRLGGIYGPGRSALDTVKKAASLKRLQGEDRDGKASSSTATATGSEGGSGSGSANWVSRIHVADICGAIIASMVAPVACSQGGRGAVGTGEGSGAGEGSVYNVADNSPAPRGEVMQFAETLLNDLNLLDSTPPSAVSDGALPLPLPLPRGDDSTVSRSGSDSSSPNAAAVAPVSSTVDQNDRVVGERARRRTTENKRVSNGHIVSSLGYVFKYPSYKEGLTALASGSNDPFE